jgi:hypothetical protein
MKTDVLILGGGILSPILSTVLRKEGLNAFVVSKKNSDKGKVRIHNSNIDFVPVLTVENSFLSMRLNTLQFSDGPIAVKYVTEGKELAILDFKIQEKSYANFIWNATNNLYHVASSEKLYGRQIYDTPMPEIRLKVERHYTDANRINYGERMGFKNGLSPYSYFAKGYEMNYEELEDIKINIKEKSVAVNGNKIFYEKLINTLPAPIFLTLIEYEHRLIFDATSTSFVIMETSDKINANLLLYDCVPATGIYRLFTPNNFSVVAQLDQNNPHDISITLIRTKHLLNLKSDIKFVAHRFLGNCYPTYISDRASFNEICSVLNSKDISMFGRFAQWQCLDLHELNWKKMIYDQLQHIERSVEVAEWC